MAGVITPTRSSGPRIRSISRMSGSLMACALSTETFGVSRKMTNTRFLGLAAAWSDSRCELTSIRSV